MKGLKRKIVIFAAAGVMSIVSALTVFGSSGIKSVRLNIKSDDIVVGKARNIDDVTVSTSGSNYSIEDVDFLEMGTTWEITDVPKITVHLVTDDNYYFSVYKDEDFRITGGKLIEARRQNSSKDLYVDVELPPLKDQVSPIDTVTLNKSGQAEWSKSAGATGYQVKLIRNNSSTVGGVQSYTQNSANLAHLITGAGTYTLKVRAINEDSSKNTTWVTSNTITVSQNDIEENRNKGSEIQGSWQQNAIGWWYALSDGSYVKSAWKQINGNFYYFNADGYMSVGWQLIDGKWYYMDTVSGKMLANTTTPDGYYVDASGVYR